MFRCTCCGRWTVEVITDLVGRDGRRVPQFYRVKYDGRLHEEYLTWEALERELSEFGVLEYLTEVDDRKAA